MTLTMGGRRLPVFVRLPEHLDDQEMRRVIDATLRMLTDALVRDLAVSEADRGRWRDPAEVLGDCLTDGSALQRALPRKGRLPELVRRAKNERNALAHYKFEYTPDRADEALSIFEQVAG